MESLVAPWLKLRTFVDTDLTVVESLWERCQTLEGWLAPRRRSFRWIGWAALFFLVVVIAMLGMQMSEFPLLPARVIPWRDVRRWIVDHPVSALAIASPVSVVLTILLLSRRGRY